MDSARICRQPTTGLRLPSAPDTCWQKCRTDWALWYRRRWVRTVLEHARIWLLPDGRVVVVLISPGGITRDKVLRPPRLFSQPELDATAEFLNRQYSGWTLEAIRADLLVKLATESERYEGLLRGALALCDPAVLGDETTSQLHVEGTAQIVGAPEFSNQAQLRELLAAIEEKHRLVTVLNACIDAPEPVLVQIGVKEISQAGDNLALISAAYTRVRRRAGLAGRAGADAHALRTGNQRGGVRGADFQRIAEQDFLAEIRK